MPNTDEGKKITDLPAVASVTAQDIVPLLQNGVTAKASIQDLKNFFGSMTISDLTVASTLNDADLLMLAQSGVNKKVTLQTFKTFLTSVDITALANASQATNSDILILEQGSGNRKITLQNLRTYILTGLNLNLPAIPTPINADNGKYLGVAGGAYVLTASSSNTLPVNVAFSTTIPINSPTTMMADTTVAGALTFTPGALIAGSTTYLKLTSNGVNVPNLDAFATYPQTMGWTNTNGAVNLIRFETDGITPFAVITRLS
jgi:hypothetical protein